MPKNLKKGDLVEWTTPQGQTIGKLKKKLTRPVNIKSHKVAASPDKPEYLVESLLSGKEAAHRPEELKKASASRKKVLLKKHGRKAA